MVYSFSIPDIHALYTWRTGVLGEWANRCGDTDKLSRTLQLT